jgi:hypothetical protein
MPCIAEYRNTFSKNSQKHFANSLQSHFSSKKVDSSTKSTTENPVSSEKKTATGTKFLRTFLRCSLHQTSKPQSSLATSTPLPASIYNHSSIVVPFSATYTPPPFYQNNGLLSRKNVCFSDVFYFILPNRRKLCRKLLS